MMRLQRRQLLPFPLVIDAGMNVKLASGCSEHTGTVIHINFIIADTVHHTDINEFERTLC